MTKYFYDDPIAAAWMAKHFGMEFVIEPSGDVVTWKEFGVVSLKSWVERFYIHPDSLHLLEPQNGDCVIDDDGWPYKIIPDNFNSKDSSDTAITKYNWMKISDFMWGLKNVAGFKIITRNINGLNDETPFFWPTRVRRSLPT